MSECAYCMYYDNGCSGWWECPYEDENEGYDPDDGEDWDEDDEAPF